MQACHHYDSEGLAVRKECGLLMNSESFIVVNRSFLKPNEENSTQGEQTAT